ncbi:MAG: hypothetical protein HQ512_06865 [Rhodospirillales bacterium]|nr:hypothetical protein [Rhodospirillales bacterium]
MSDQPTVTDIRVFQAPWNKQVTLQNVAYEGGMSLLRVRIKEGSRFTDLELDPQTATDIAEAVSGWAAGQSEG